MSRISPVQMFAAMLCGHLFSLMTFFPQGLGSPAEYMIGIALAGIIEVLFLVPVYLLYKHFDGKDPCTVSAEVSPVPGRLAGVFYAGVLLYFAYRVTGNLSYFLDNVSSGAFPRTASVIAVCAVSAYLALMKPSVIGKTAGLMLALFFVFAVVVLLFSAGASEDGLLSFHLASVDIKGGVYASVKCELLRSLDMVLLLVMLPEIKGSPLKAGAYYLAVKTVLAVLAVGFVTMMLGDYVLVSKLPFSALGAYSGSSMTERFDAVFMAVWTTLAVVRLGAVFHCAGRSLCHAVRALDRSAAVILSAAVSAATALISFNQSSWESTAYNTDGRFIMAAAMLAVPLSVMGAKRLADRREQLERA